MQALSQRPHEVQAFASRRMLSTLNRDSRASRAPAGHRYLQKKRSYSREPASETTRTMNPTMNVVKISGDVRWA